MTDCCLGLLKPTEMQELAFVSCSDQLGSLAALIRLCGCLHSYFSVCRGISSRYRGREWDQRSGWQGLEDLLEQQNTVACWNLQSWDILFKLMYLWSIYIYKNWLDELRSKPLQNACATAYYVLIFSFFYFILFFIFVLFYSLILFLFHATLLVNTVRIMNYINWCSIW